MKMRARSACTSLTILVLCFASQAFGQGVSGSPYLTFEQRCAFLVSNSYVAKDLHLSAAQVKAAKTALNRYDTASHKLLSSSNLDEKASRANDAELANDNLALLTVGQKDQILALGIQEVGTDCLSDRGVSQRLNLTSAQSSKIVAILDQRSKKEEDVEAMVGEAIAKIPEPKSSKDSEAYEKKKLSVYASYEGERQRLQHERLASDKVIVAQLTDAQRSIWQRWSASSKKPTKPTKVGKKH